MPRRVRQRVTEEKMRDDFRQLAEDNGKTSYNIPNDEVDWIDENARAFSYYSGGAAFTVIVIREENL